jgi:TRAP-type C4-dicarboxylate transport system permease small subunit
MHNRRVALARALTSATRAIAIFATLIALLLPLPVVWEVVMNGLGTPPIWVFETTGYAIILLAFAASGYGLETGHHFRVSLLPDRLPRLAMLLARLSAVLELAFGLVLLVAGANQVSIDWVQDLRSDSLLSIPQYLPQLAFPIGGVAIALQGLAHLLVPPVPKPNDSDVTGRG